MRQAYWGAAAEALLLFDSVLEAAKATGHLNNTVVLLVRATAPAALKRPPPTTHTRTPPVVSRRPAP